jgi:FAD/FMN-containing dehydrogenase
MDLKSALSEVIKGEIFDDEDTLLQYSKDASIFQIKPQLVVSPINSDDIQSLVKYVNAHADQNLSLTPRAAATCMSGGAINDSIVMDLTKHFNKVVFVGENSAITQPGVFYRDFEKETLAKNLLLPCYTSSRELNTVGGMVGNNSAGEKSLSHGQTERYVKQLKVILSDGKEYTFKPLKLSELEEKLKQDDFEGEIYRKLHSLIDENKDLIEHAKPKTSKNSTGYGLWNVWHDEMFDLTKVIVGSQGTLGVVTEIEFKLEHPQPNTAMLEIELEDLEKLDEIVMEVLKFTPESFECFDDQTLKFATKYIGDVVKDFKKTPIWFAWVKLLPEFIESWRQKFPKLVLIAEFTSFDPKTPMEQVHLAQSALSRFRLRTRAVASNDEEKYWIIRRDSFNILRHHSGENLRTAPFIDDICINPKDLPQFLPRLKQIMDLYVGRITYTIAGHIGNGNFHIIPLMDLHQEEIKQLIPEISQKVFDLVFEFKGTMAAEHNDGLVRGMYLPKMYGENMYQLFKNVKQIFDPNNIFNPHKKTDATMEYAVQHITGDAGIRVADYAKSEGKKG